MNRGSTHIEAGYHTAAVAPDWSALQLSRQTCPLLENQSNCFPGERKGRRSRMYDKSSSAFEVYMAESFL